MQEPKEITEVVKKKRTIRTPVPVAAHLPGISSNQLQVHHSKSQCQKMTQEVCHAVCHQIIKELESRWLDSVSDSC